MLQGNNWKIPEFTLSWERREEAHHHAESRRWLQGTDSTGLLTQRSASSSNRSSITPSVSQGLGLYLIVEPTTYGAAIFKIGVLMAVLDSFYVVPKTSDELTRPFSVIPVPYNVALRMQTVLFREEPPFFEYRDAALGLATVPSLLIFERHEDWTETTFDYRVNGDLVGRGDIVRV